MIFTPNTILSASNLNDAFEAKADSILTLNTQTNSYTATLADAYKTIVMNASGAATGTIPTNAAVAYAIGTCLSWVNNGSSAVTIAPAGGVTITGGSLVLAQYESGVAIKTQTNTWLWVRGGGFPKAVCSGGTEATLTNPDGDGRNYKKHTFTANGTLTVSVPGYAKCLIVGRGSSGYAGNKGSGGRVFEGLLYLPAGSHTITVPGSGTNVDGYGSGIGTVMWVGSVKPSPSDGSGAGYMTGSGTTGWTSTISASSVTYAAATGTSTNPGDGGPNAGFVQGGIVIVRYEV